MTISAYTEVGDFSRGMVDRAFKSVRCWSLPLAGMDYKFRGIPRHGDIVGGLAVFNVYRAYKNSTKL